MVVNASFGRLYKLSLVVCQPYPRRYHSFLLNERKVRSVTTQVIDRPLTSVLPSLRFNNLFSPE